MEVSHDTELAYRSVLNANNKDFSKTSISRRTLVVSEDYSLAVVVVVVFYEVHGRGM